MNVVEMALLSAAVIVAAVAGSDALGLALSTEINGAVAAIAAATP